MLHIKRAVLIALVLISRHASQVEVAWSSDMPTAAVDHAAVLAPFVNEDTCVVAYVNVASMDVTAESDQIAKLLPTLSDQGQASVLAVNALGNVLKTLQNSGVDAIYVVAGLKDAYISGGPIVVVSLKSGGDTKAVVAMLQGFVQTLSMAGAHEWLPNKISVRQHDGRTILIGSDPIVSRYEKLTPNKRDDLVETMSRLVGDGADLAAVFSPGQDFRRVIRELWPTLPEPMTPLKGELADKWLRLEFSAKMRPSASGQLVLQATDAASAQVFVDLWHTLPEWDRFEDDAEHRQRLRQVLQTIAESLPPRIDGSRVVMQFPTDESQLQRLRGLVAETADKALEKARHNDRMNQFKLLALGMLNYADRYKHLPPPAIRDKDGKPLLSWRVAILPYLDEDGLYKQFHLGEPWDSPYNRELAKKMPDVYRDPDPKIRAAAGEGKTTFVVPVGTGTAFDTKDGLMLREINDGTSNTVMIVEVVPERAVEWTKPADWGVDMASPAKGVERSDRRQFTTAYCDGSARLLPVDLKPDIWRAILTRNGGETVDWP